MGSRETEVNEFAVMPWILPGSRSTVTTVTPVEKWPRALRNSIVESDGVGILEVFEDTILGAAKAKRRPFERRRDLKRGEDSWRERSRYWAEQERKVPDWPIAWQRLGNIS